MRSPAVDLERPQALTLVAVGLVAGVLSGLFGVGGGIVMVPAMVLLLGFGQHRAHATSLAAIVPIAIVGAVVFGGAGSVEAGAAAVLAATSVIGVRAGARTMPRLSSVRLARAFGAFMVVVALVLLVQ